MPARRTLAPAGPAAPSATDRATAATAAGTMARPRLLRSSGAPYYGPKFVLPKVRKPATSPISASTETMTAALSRVNFGISQRKRLRVDKDLRRYDACGNPDRLN